MKQIFLILFSLAASFANARAQGPVELPVIEMMKEDTAKVNRLNALAARMIASDPPLAIELLNRATLLARRIQYSLGCSIAHSHRASMFLYERKTDSAGLLLDSAWALVATKKGKAYTKQQASLHQKFGALLQQQQLYDTAIKRYLLATDLYRQAGQEELAIVGFYNIAVIYGFLDQPLKSLFYARQVNRIAEQVKDPEFLLRSYIALGGAFVATAQFDSLIYYVQKGLDNPQVAANPFMRGKFLQLKGIYFFKGQAKYEAAITAFDSALTAFEKVNLPFEKALIHQNMAQLFLRKKDFPGVLESGRKALVLSRAFPMHELESAVLYDMAMAAAALQQTDSAFVYLTKHLSLRDSLDKLNQSRLVNELESKYQSQKRDAMLSAQQNTIAKKNIINYVLAGSAVVLLALFALGYFNYRQKQALQQQRITELETQQQLMATAAVLKGEEQERTRLAKDLHDGLGGMLSGIKYSFNNIRGNMILTDENRQAFERSMDMLDTSIHEMRRVAHNMMPEVLLKFGLDTALKDFCNDINRMSVIKITYQSIGLKEVALPQTTAITIYRVVQELIHNTLKHSAASTAIVQLSYESENISLTVEDDGKGFDTNVLSRSAGIGWNNIRSRVEFLKGQIDVQSEQEKGTSVHIEIDLS